MSYKKIKLCRECGEILFNRQGNAIYCRKCAVIVRTQWQKNWFEKHKGEKRGRKNGKTTNDNSNRETYK